MPNLAFSEFAVSGFPDVLENLLYYKVFLSGLWIWAINLKVDLLQKMVGSLGTHCEIALR